MYKVDRLVFAFDNHYHSIYDKDLVLVIGRLAMGCSTSKQNEASLVASAPSNCVVVPILSRNL